MAIKPVKPFQAKKKTQQQIHDEKLHEIDNFLSIIDEALSSSKETPDGK